MPEISQLPVATQVNSADILPIVQTGTTKQATFSLVTTLVGTGLVISESQVTNLTSDLAARMLKANNLSDVTSVPTSRQNLGIGPLLNGQLIIGSTGLNPVLTTLTGGSGVSISNGAGSITISASGGGIGWTDVTGTSATMNVNSGYIADNAGLVTLTMPATASLGDAINVMGKGSGGWTIAQPAGVTIHVGSSATTTGITGSISSTNQWDSIELVCVTANTTWAALSGPQGVLTIA
jgi:hypothetical protein